MATRKIDNDVKRRRAEFVERCFAGTGIHGLVTEGEPDCPTTEYGMSDTSEDYPGQRINGTEEVQQ